MRYVFAIAITGLLFSCGEPLAPEASQWQIITRLPDNIICRRIVPVSNTVYGIGFHRDEETGQEIPLILSFSHGAYETTELNTNINLRCISRANSPNYQRIWIGGSIAVKGDYGPLLLRQNEGGRWETVPITNIPGSEIKAVYPYSDTGTWLIVGPHGDSGEPGILVRYDAGDVKAYFPFGNVVAHTYTDEFGKTTVFAIARSGNTQASSFTLYYSYDNGVSWSMERIPVDFGAYRINVIAAPYLYQPIIDKLALIYVCVFGDIANGTRGLVTRYDNEGKGDYEMTFLSYPGPNFDTIYAIAARPGNMELSRDVFSDLIAVGPNTTVVSKNGVFTLEEVPWRLTFHDVKYNQDTDGYYAVGYNETFNEYELLYHP